MNPKNETQVKFVLGVIVKRDTNILNYSSDETIEITTRLGESFTIPLVKISSIEKV